MWDEQASHSWAIMGAKVLEALTGPAVVPVPLRQEHVPILVHSRGSVSFLGSAGQCPSPSEPLAATAAAGAQ